MSDYYNLEKAAEVLGKSAGDLNRLREAGKIRAFRDGSAWKFRKEDIDNYLAQEIRDKSASAFDEEGLLTGETDEEEKPTMMADTNSFDKLDLEITTNADDDGVVAVGDDSDGIILGKGGQFDAQSAGASSIDLNGDFDDDDDFASGISILDDPSDLSGSNIDLASDSGISIDDSGLTLGSTSSASDSGSGISILSDDEQPAAAETGGAGQDDDDFDFELDPLPSDSGPAPVPEPAPAPAPAASADDDVFDLQPLEEEKPALDGGTGETYGVAGETASTESKELDLDDDDFQLEPDLQPQESESESSSQMLELDMNDLGAGGAAGGIDLSKPDAGGAPADSFDLGESGGDAFAPSSEGGEFGGGFDDPFGASGGEFGGGGEFGDDGGMTQSDFVPVSGGDDAAWAADAGAAADGELQPEVQGKPIDFNGLGIGLGLVPCILLLILAGAGIWELIRSMWSWDQSFSLTGPVLEMIGGLLKLF